MGDRCKKQKTIISCTDHVPCFRFTNCLNGQPFTKSCKRGSRNPTRYFQARQFLHEKQEPFLVGNCKYLPSRTHVPQTLTIEQRTEKVLHSIVTIDKERHNLQRSLVKDARR